MGTRAHACLSEGWLSDVGLRGVNALSLAFLAPMRLTRSPAVSCCAVQAAEDAKLDHFRALLARGPLQIAKRQ